MGKQIGDHAKEQVVKLFLLGHAYSEIAAQVGIAIGSVPAIIEDFRNGVPPVPTGEYVDALRKLIVDVGKSGMSVTQVAACLGLHNKLTEMSIAAAQMGEWLDLSAAIASETVSNAQFVATVLELAELEAETGLDHGELVGEYKANLKECEALNAQIEGKQAKLEGLDGEYGKKKQHAKEQLDSISKAAATAQQSYAQQTANLEAQLGTYLAKNKLDWTEVKLATALLGSGLCDAGLDEEDIAKLSKQVAKVGSLVTTAKQLEHKVPALTSELQKLVTQKAGCVKEVSKLQGEAASLSASIKQEKCYAAELASEVASKEAELDLTEKKSTFLLHELQANFLITRFLMYPEGVSNDDFERFFRLMEEVRKRRQFVESRDSGMVPIPVPQQMREELDQYTEQAWEFLAKVVVDRVLERMTRGRDGKSPD